ncbi:MAG: hypothetical protein R3D65_14305 [Zhengella sp.]|uniref:hypothetical protein n=1 Tax=Zhengella sp. TaxID=2282762 RepID=UPI0035288DFE
MNRIQTGYIPPDPRWPMPQSLLDKLAAAQPSERGLPASPWCEDERLHDLPRNWLAWRKSA